MYNCPKHGQSGLFRASSSRAMTKLGSSSVRSSPAPSTKVEWRREGGPTPYPDAVALMEERAAAVGENRARELVWLLQHPPLYTAGTSTRDEDLLDARFPVF